MFLLRQLMILALMPLAVWNGMPHVACRCSNGEVRLYCPRLNQSQTVADSPACGNSSNGETHKSCCGAAQGKKCCGSQGSGTSHQGAECCAAGCRCTAVYIQSDVGPVLKVVSVPEWTQFALAVVPMSVVHFPRVTQVDLSSIDTNPRVPDDLIVLYERWLI